MDIQMWANVQENILGGQWDWDFSICSIISNEKVSEFDRKMKGRVQAKDEQR